MGRRTRTSALGTGLTVWLTGLPSAGKSTIARTLATLCPEMVVETHRETPHQSAQRILFRTQSLGHLKAGRIEELTA